MSEWAYALKTNAEGVIQRFKARICARIDQAKIALSVLLRLSPSQLDANLAYLYAPLDETIYHMRPPDGVESPPGMVFRLSHIVIRTTAKWAKLEFTPT